MKTLYTVSNPRGVNERTVMHPWKGYSGHYDNGEELLVYQTYSIVIMYRTYVWGRITEKPDQWGRHKYVCLTLDNNTLCTKEETLVMQPDKENSTWAKEIDTWARANGYNGVTPEPKG